MAWQAVEMSEDELAEVDRWIHRLARGRGRLRLRIGQALAMNGEAQHHEFGFDSFGAYVIERLSVKARWAGESRALARRLEALPRIREALETGRIGWCMAEVLARGATPEDEAALLEEAQRETIRSMRRRVRELCARRKEAKTGSAEVPAGSDERPLTAPELLARHPLAQELGIDVQDLGPIRSDTGEVEDDPLHMLMVTAPAEEHWMLEATRVAVEHVMGVSVPGAFIEPLLAEGYTALLCRFGGEDPISDEMRARHEAARKMRAMLEERRARAEAAAAPAIVAQREVEPGDAPAEDERIPEDAGARERRLRQWCAELASRDLWLGRHLCRFFAADGWRRLGYASETQYAQERLGMARSSMRRHMRLARQSAHLEKLTEALSNGEVGYEAALLLIRVLGPDNEEAWVERAKKRTFKHLREELEMSETLARMMNLDLTDVEPPTDEELEVWFRFERDAVSGAMFERVLEPILTGGNGGENTEAQRHGEGSGSGASSVGSEATCADAVRTFGGTSGDASAEGQAAVGASAERSSGESGAVRMSVGASAEASGVDGAIGTMDTDASGVENGAVRMSVGASADESSGASDVVRMSVEASTETHGASASALGVGEVRMFGNASGGENSVARMEVEAASAGASRDAVGTALEGSAAAGEVDGSAVRSAGSEGTDTIDASSEMSDASDAWRGRDDAARANRHRGKITRFFPVRESTLFFWRELEDAHRRSGSEMGFLTFLSVAFWAAWGPVIAQPQDSLWQHIYDRDRRRCTSPVCTECRLLEDHHLKFRAHGGGDEEENNTTLGAFCHRPGVHEGRIQVFPPASRMRWLIGRPPLIEVIGRDKRELA